MEIKAINLTHLKTDRLTIRAIELSDAPYIFSLRSDAEINLFLDRKKAENVNDAIEFIQKILKNTKEGNTFYWAIIITEDQSFVGTICGFNIDEVDKSCEIGFELLPMFQKKGIMKEAATSVISFLTQEKKLEKIRAFVHRKNINSINLLKSLSFRLSNDIVNEEPDMLSYYFFVSK